MSLTRVQVEQQFKSALVGIEQISCNQGVLNKGIEFELKSATYPNGIQVKILDENNRPVTLDNVDNVKHIKIVDINSGKEIYSNIDVDKTTHPPENAITALTKELKKGENGAFLNYAISLCKTDINDYLTSPESLHISMSAIKDQIKNLNIDNSIKEGNAGIRPHMLCVESEMSIEAKLLLNKYINTLYAKYNDFCRIDIYKLFKHMTSGSDTQYALTPHDINQLLDLFYFQNYNDINIREQDGGVISDKTSHTTIEKDGQKFFIQGCTNPKKNLEQKLKESNHEDGIYLQPKLTTDKKGYGHWTLSICKKSGTKYTSYTINSLGGNNGLFLQPPGNSCGLWTTLATTNVIKYGLDNFLYLYTDTTTPLAELCGRGQAKSTNIDFPLISECSDNLVALKRTKNFKLTLDKKEYSFTDFKTTRQSSNSYIYSYTIKDNSSNVLGKIQFEVKGPKFNTFSSFTYIQNSNKKEYTYKLPKEQRIKDFCSNPNNFLTTISNQITSWGKPDKLQGTKNELNRLFNTGANIKYKLGDNSVSNQEGDKFVQLEYTYDLLGVKNNKISISVCDNSGQPVKLKDFNKNAKNYKLIITSTTPQTRILDKLDLTSENLSKNIISACNSFKIREESKLIEVSYNDIQNQLNRQLSELEKNLSSYKPDRTEFNELSSITKNIRKNFDDYKEKNEVQCNKIKKINSKNAKQNFLKKINDNQTANDKLKKTFDDNLKKIPQESQILEYLTFKSNTQNKIEQKRKQLLQNPTKYDKTALQKIQKLQDDIKSFITDSTKNIQDKDKKFKELNDELKKAKIQFENEISTPLINNITNHFTELDTNIDKQLKKEDRELKLQQELKKFNNFKVDKNTYTLTILNKSSTSSADFSLDIDTYEYTYSYVLKDSNRKDIANITLKLDKDRENITGLSYKPKDKDKSIDYNFDIKLNVDDFIKNSTTKLPILQNNVSNILRHYLKEKNITNYFESIKNPSNKSTISIEYDNSGVTLEKDKKVHLIYTYPITNIEGKLENKSITIELYDKTSKKPITIESFDNTKKDYEFKIIKENNVKLKIPKEIIPDDKTSSLRDQIKSMCKTYSDMAQSNIIKEEIRKIYKDIEKAYKELESKYTNFNSSVNAISFQNINEIISKGRDQINNIKIDVNTNKNKTNKIKAKSKKENFEGTLNNIQREIVKQETSLGKYSKQHLEDSETLQEYKNKNTENQKYITSQKSNIEKINNLLNGNTKTPSNDDLKNAKDILNNLNKQIVALEPYTEKVDTFKKNLYNEETQINNTIIKILDEQAKQLSSINTEIEIQEKKEKKENDLKDIFQNTLRSIKLLYAKDSKLKKEYCYFAYNSTINEDTYQFNHIIEIEQDNKKFGNITLTLDDDRENITGFEYKKDNAIYKHEFQSSVKVEEIINNTNNAQKIFNTKISTQIVDDLLIEENKDTIKDIFNTEDTKNITIDFIKGQTNEEKDKNIQLTYINPNDKSKKIKVLLCDENNLPITLNNFKTEQKVKLINHGNKNQNNILAEIDLKNKNNYNKIFEDYFNKKEEQKRKEEEEIITRNAMYQDNNNDNIYTPPEPTPKKSNGVISSIFSTLLGGVAFTAIILATPSLGIGVAIAAALSTFGVTKSISALFKGKQSSTYNYNTPYQQNISNNPDLLEAINYAFRPHENNTESNNNENDNKNPDNSNNSKPKNLDALSGIGGNDNASEPPKTGDNSKPKGNSPRSNYK